MQSSSDKKKTQGAPSPAVQEAERRIAERHMFTAGAEVIELKSGARFSTRTTDLGPGGCFVDTTVPFSIGSDVRITLNKGKNICDGGHRGLFAAWSRHGHRFHRA